MIELENVSKSFDAGRTFAVRGVTLSVRPGELVAMVGASGSGKTTTLKAVNRLIEAEGTIRVAGEPVTARRPHELRRSIGYVFQGIGLFPHMTVAENIAVTPKLLGWPRDEVAARVRELLATVRLPLELAARMPSELSGGQRQRVGVARALAAKPKIMLMDEPFGALDAITRDALGVEYRRLHDALGVTTLMVTHDVLEALLLADRVVLMSAGQIAAQGTPRELFEEHTGGDVRALMDMPRRQAERLRALLSDSASPSS